MFNGHLHILHAAGEPDIAYPVALSKSKLSNFRRNSPKSQVFLIQSEITQTFRISLENRFMRCSLDTNTYFMQLQSQISRIQWHFLNRSCQIFAEIRQNRRFFRHNLKLFRNDKVSNKFHGMGVWHDRSLRSCRKKASQLQSSDPFELEPGVGSVTSFG